MTTPAPKVVVIGAGVIGLTTALAAAHAGHDVKVISAQRPEETVSAVAAAIWAPYHAEPAAWINPWAAATFDILARLADTTPEAGVQMREGIVVNREGSAPLAWPETVAGNRPALLSELPRGASSGTVCTVPIATMPTYLKWLQKECTALGVAWEWRTARSLVLEADPGAVIVLATGLQSLGLHPDDGMYPVRGQVAIIGNTKVDRWIIDDANPAGPSYIIPRTDEIICGGTAETGAASLAPDPETQKRILETTMDLSPGLSKGTFLGSRVGLRPGRHLIRLELRDENGIPVIHSYGHGGSGVTVSWGVANATLELINTASQHPSN
ncbi:NAD(P)/FAD-dependent oxidoreductase [Arthrobacter sp. KNU40]|uniref:NAD(P)/FAD-dependent oxidoreductase n=1 Tax=Arthrobacter sp. KNU40 TaxID=3447965 RepID=UPI003F603EC0